MSQHLDFVIKIIIAETGISGSTNSSESLVSIIGGAVGGAINIIIFLVLITLLVTVVKSRIKQKLKSNIDTTLSMFNYL